MHLDSSKRLTTRNSVDYSVSEFDNEPMTPRPKSTKKVYKLKNLEVFNGKSSLNYDYHKRNVARINNENQKIA